jgi:hypothetical protein
MPGIDGGTLHEWRRSRGWDVPKMARELRRAARESGETVAAHDGLIRMIRDWERGRHNLTERYELLYATALDVEPDHLAAGPAVPVVAAPPQPVPTSPVTPRPPGAQWAAGIYDAVIHPVEAARSASRFLDSAPIPAVLRHHADTAVAAELAADYARLAAVLPHLIGAAEFASLHATDQHQMHTRSLLADVYTIAGWALIKADAAGAAWIAAQRAIQAAEAAGDMLRAAASTRCLAEVHMRAGEYSDAARTAFLAAAYLYSAPPDDLATLVLRGSALLSAAAASARRGDAREARASFNAAVSCAEPMQAERSDFGAVFGPVNTAIHRVAVAVELGDHKAAVDASSAVNLTKLPPQLAERRARYLIDVARAHAGLRDDQAAEVALFDAERAAPDELRGHRLTRAVLGDLFTRERKSSGVRELAARCGVLDR